jgi:hypothetical protein
MTDARDHHRRYPRIPLQNAVLVKKLGDDLVEEFASTRSLAIGGCGFFSQEALGEGSLLDILISIERQVVQVTARVVYEHPSEGGFDVGVEFLKLDEQKIDLLGELLDRASKAEKVS